VRSNHAARGVLRVVAWAALTLALAAPGAGAAEVRIDVQYGFGGVARANCWSPVTVELSNDGPERQGLLLLTPADRRIAAAYPKRGSFIRLPQGSRQRYTLFWGDLGPGGTTPIAMFSGFTSPEPSVNYLDNNQTLMVVAGFPPGALGYLARVERTRLSRQPAGYSPQWSPPQQSVKGTIVPAHVQPRYLPESPLAYFQADLLVLGPLFASDMSPGTQAAITSWVRIGGNLVIIGGADAARLNDPFFRNLLPVEGLTASSVTLGTALRSFGISAGAPAAVTIGVPKPGAEVLAEAPGVPLIVRGRVGDGTVTFIAFDPTQAPVASSPGLEKLWLPLFNDRAFTYYSSIIGSGAAFYNQVTNIKQIKTPPLLMVIGFLGLYFLLLIPINHFLLARRKRRELAWLTTPVIVALFVAGAYAFGYNIKGPRLLVRQKTMIEAGEGAREGLAMSNFGVFSPARRAYDIRVGLRGALVGAADFNPYNYGYGRGPFAPEPGSGLVHDERDPWIERAQIAMWGMSIYSANGAVDMGGPVRASVSAQGLRPTGWIENDTKWTLKDAHLVAPGGGLRLRLGDIAPGKKCIIEQHQAPAPPPAPPRRRLPYRGPYPYEPDQSQSLEQIAISQLMPQRLKPEMGLLCRISPTPVPVDVGRACEYDTETVLLVRVPVAVAHGRVRLPLRTYAFETDRSMSGGGPTPILEQDPDIIYTFTPPSEASRLRVDSVDIYFDIPSFGTSPLCDVLMYDYRAQAWKAVGAVPQAPMKFAGGRGAMRGSKRLSVANAARFVGPTGKIKVQVRKRKGVPMVPLRNLDIVVSGQW
jgi:hypothetical protein